jgi:CDP-2,3-bis-(O-geranylgeranyl)-sn-glycerol synthase
VAWISILHALWLFLPAYVANMSPVFSAKLLPRWNAPIDGGRTSKDGKRLLGPGKTWRGLVGGIVTGAATALLMAAIAPPHTDEGFLNGWDFGAQGFQGAPIGSYVEPSCAEPDPGQADCRVASDPSTPWPLVAVFGGIVGGMALAGDAVKSYFKRRLGKDRGHPWFPFDQLDFVVFGVLGMLAASPLLADGWLQAALLGDWVVLATLLILTPLLHYLVNVVGYWLKLKEVPW